MAMNNLIRNAWACIGAVLGKPLIEVLGNGVWFTILGGVCWASVVFIWAIIKVRCAHDEITDYSGEPNGVIPMI